MPIRYSGSPIPLSSAERDYRHSISVVCFAGGAVDVREEEIPRVVPFLAVPANGAAPLAEVEALLTALECDADLPPALRPFVEVSVLVDGPEPHLQSRIMAALDGKAVRLTRVVRSSKGTGTAVGLADTGADLSELSADTVFAQLHEAAHGGAPAEDLARAFEQLLIACNEAEDN